MGFPLNLPRYVMNPTESATFGMGCFYLPDSLYGAFTGVIRTKVGYSGGTLDNPTYKNLGDHTEVVQVDYDPKSIDYEDLLEMFWDNHNPGDKNPTQYASRIFYRNAEQKEIAQKSLKEYSQETSRELTTKLLPAGKFFDAEDYHQKYRLQKQKDLCKLLGINQSDGDLLKKSIVAARVNGWLLGTTSDRIMQDEAEEFGLNQEEITVLLDGIDKGISD